MNKQNKGNGKRGIEWTDYTWNPVGGCRHACKWEMPDGSVAQCYAKSVAEGVAMAAYPEGFEYHYFKPMILDEPYKLKTPSRIFLDSMSDLMGHWVPDDDIRRVFDACRAADWHQFQLLTKNPARLLQFAGDIPENVWIGVSLPPTFMWGKRLSHVQQARLFAKTLRIIGDLQPLPNIKWLSLEPLSFDAAPIMAANMDKLPDWIVIGAASNGRNLYQPDPAHVGRILHIADMRQIPIFFKGNLEWEPRREEFPDVARVE
jgi:protein gp37